MPKDSAFAALGGETALVNLSSGRCSAAPVPRAAQALLPGGVRPAEVGVGTVRVKSAWSGPKISSSVHSTRPVAVYEVSQVLLPVQIFKSSELNESADAEEASDASVLPSPALAVYAAGELRRRRHL